jgi:serine/threonine-protein kinase ATR
LDYLQDETPRSESRSICVVLPCGRLDWPLFCLDQDQDSANDINQCTYSLHDLSRCISHVKSILQLLIEISIRAVSSNRASPAFQDYISWMLDSYISTHGLEKRWCTDPKVHHQISIGWSFVGIKQILSSFRDFIPPSISRKGYVSLSVLCVDLLSDMEEISDPSLQLNLSSAILNMAFMCKKSDSIRKTISVILLPILQDVSSNENASLLLGKDFVVSPYVFIHSRTSLMKSKKSASILSQACGVIGLQNTFDSQDLLGEFEQLGLLGNRERHDSDKIGDVDRPNKRRRVNDEVDNLHEITSDLYQSLGAQNIVGLDGLSDVTE